MVYLPRYRLGSGASNDLATPAGQPSNINKLARFGNSIFARIALWCSCKLLFLSVLSPSPYNLVAAAAFLPFIHEFTSYTLQWISAPTSKIIASTSQPTWKRILACSLLLCISRCISYWSLAVLPLDVFQIITLLDVPSTLVFQHLGCFGQDSLLRSLPLATVCSVFITGIAVASTQSLSQTTSLFSVILIVCNSAIIKPFLSLLIERDPNAPALSHMMKPWTVLSHVAIWIAVEAAQNSVIILPQFWTIYVITVVVASCILALVTESLSSLSSQWFSSETLQLPRLAQTLGTCFVAWITQQGQLTLPKTAGLMLITGAEYIHFHIHSASIPSIDPYTYTPLAISANSAFGRVLHNKRARIRCALATTLISLVILGILATSSDSSEYSPRTDIQPFSSQELLHVNGTDALGCDRIYAINLVQRGDRREQLVAMAHKLDLDLYITPATTVNSSAVLDRLELVHTRPLGGWWPFGSHLSKGELALTMSHLRIFKDVVHQGLESALVLEDDVVMEKNIKFLWAPFLENIPEDMDLLYLGYCDNPPGERIASLRPPYPSYPTYRLDIAAHPSCSHAYVVSRKGAQRLLALLERPQNAYDDSVVGLVDLGILKVYSIHPSIVNQDESTPSDLASKGWWTPIKRSSVVFGKWLKGVTEYSLQEPVAIEEKDREWAKAWRVENEVDGIWRHTEL